MRRSLSAWLVLVLITLAGGICDARQTATQEPPPGPPSAIVLPPKIVAGERATLAVLDSSGRLVPGAVVDVPGNKPITTDVTGRSTFIAPSQAGTMTARLQAGSAFSAAVIPASATPLATNSSQILFPSVIALGDRFELMGAGFRGDADQNRLLLGDQPALILASSSVALVAIPSTRTALGNEGLTVEVGGRSLGSPIVVVSLAVIGPVKALAAGERGVLRIEVTGTQDQLLVEVRNFSPDVVDLPRGNVAQLNTSGGTPNVARVELKGMKPGDYSVSARIVQGLASSAEKAR